MPSHSSNQLISELRVRCGPEKGEVDTPTTLSESPYSVSRLLHTPTLAPLISTPPKVHPRFSATTSNPFPNESPRPETKIGAMIARSQAVALWLDITSLIFSLGKKQTNDEPVQDGRLGENNFGESDQCADQLG